MNLILTKALGLHSSLKGTLDFPGAQMVKNLPAMQEMWVQSLGQEEKEITIHSNILAWEIPWTEEPDGLQSMGS